MLRLKLLTILLFLLGTVPALSQAMLKPNREYTNIIDLKSELLVYNNAYDTYLPYVQGTPFPGSTALCWLQLAKYKNYRLLVKGKQATTLFVNQNVTDIIAKNTTKIYPIDSLYRVYGDSCLAAIYAPDLDLNGLTLSIVGRQAVASTSSASSDGFLQVNQRAPQYFYNYFILAALVVLAALAVLKNAFPRVFNSYYSLADTLSTRPVVNDAFSYKLGGTGQLAFVAAYCLLFSFLLISLFHVAGLEGRLSWLLEAPDVSAYLGAWLKVAVLLFLLQLLKYALLQLAAGLFGIDVAANHFFDYLRFSQIVTTFILAVVIILIIGLSNWAVYGAGVLLKLALFFAVLRIAYLFYKLTAAGERRKTYLFSYLCATEILPLLVGLKLLVA